MQEILSERTSTIEIINRLRQIFGMFSLKIAKRLQIDLLFKFLWVFFRYKIGFCCPNNAYNWNKPTYTETDCTLCLSLLKKKYFVFFFNRVTNR